MTRHERTQFFKRLCEMRDQYRTRGVADRPGTTTIAEAIIVAELAMTAPRTGTEQPPAA
jgi:hypothetical protein